MLARLTLNIRPWGLTPLTRALQDSDILIPFSSPSELHLQSRGHPEGKSPNFLREAPISQLGTAGRPLHPRFPSNTAACCAGPRRLCPRKRAGRGASSSSSWWIVTGHREVVPTDAQDRDWTPEPEPRYRASPAAASYGRLWRPRRRVDTSVN